jgi:membrane fusion protein, copper/silver efflux system
MKTIFKSRRTSVTIIIVLMIGILIGWIIKPSSDPHRTTDSEVHQHDEVSTEVWTCSMHPQIRQSEPGDCPLCGMDLIPATSGRTGAGSNQMVFEMTPEAIAMANIQTSRVTGVSSEGEIFLTGKIRADEQRIATVTARYPGRIEELFINFTGQPVRQGDRLATIYSPELITAQKELTEAARLRNSIPQLYDAAREKLRLWGLAPSQIDEIEASGKILDRFDILAERSGIVLQRNVTTGDYVSTGSVLFNIADLSRVWIMLDAYETDLRLIRTGDQVTFTAAGNPGKDYTATISFIDPVLNPNTRAASVRAEVANQNNELKPEMFVNARVKPGAKTGEGLLTIPRTALLWTGKRSIVYVKVPDAEYPSFEMREITIGARQGDMWQVESGLDQGEEIVTNGVFTIDAAAQLSGNYSMMMRPQSKTMEVASAFRKQITDVAYAYFDVKNALVNDNPEAAAKASEKVTAALKQTDMTLLEGKAHDHWMMLLKPLNESSQKIASTTDIEEQREHFNVLSEHIIETTASFGLEIDRVYKQFCPMAFDDKGAFWLSESDQILNPYFGDMMLTCGEVTETFRKGQPIYAGKETSGPPAAAGHQH